MNSGFAATGQPPSLGKRGVLQRTLEPGPHWRLYCTIRRLPFVARRWRRTRRRLAVGSAAGWPTLRPCFGKASAFPKPQPSRASEAAPDPQPLCPIHTNNPPANYSPQQLVKPQFDEWGRIYKNSRRYMNCAPHLPLGRRPFPLRHFAVRRYPSPAGRSPSTTFVIIQMRIQPSNSSSNRNFLLAAGHSP